MTKLAFADLPWVVRGAVLATGFMAWILFEEIGIDRNGWDRFLLFYRVGKFCVYDLAMSLVLIGVFVMLNRRKNYGPHTTQ